MIELRSRNRSDSNGQIGLRQRVLSEDDTEENSLLMGYDSGVGYDPSEEVSDPEDNYPLLMPVGNPRFETVAFQQPQSTCCIKTGLVFSAIGTLFLTSIAMMMASNSPYILVGNNPLPAPEDWHTRVPWRRKNPVESTLRKLVTSAIQSRQTSETDTESTLLTRVELAQNVYIAAYMYAAIFLWCLFLLWRAKRRGTLNNFSTRRVD